MRDHLVIAPLSVLSVSTCHLALAPALPTPRAHARVQADLEHPRRTPEEDVPCFASLNGADSGVERHPEDGVVCVCKPFRQARAEVLPPGGELPRFDIEYL